MTTEHSDPKVDAVGCVVLLLLLPFTTALYGYVLRVLWTWFMVDDFGLRPLSWHAALGLSVVVGMLAKSHAPQRNPPSPWTTVASEFIYPLLYLFFGWAYHVVTR
jgi:hypothetical protein